jgi:hypothetical protein
MEAIAMVFDAIENEVPEFSLPVLDAIHVAVLKDHEKVGIPDDKVVFVVMWYASGIMRDPEVPIEEKTATFAVIRCVEKNWPTGFKALKGRL